MNSQLKQQLKQQLGNHKVIFRDEQDSIDFSTYGLDRTRVYQPNFDVVVLPESTEDVASIVKFAYQHDLELVVAGGRTGYAGGSVAIRGELVIAMDKMNQFLDFDPILGAVSVQGGMITADLHQLVEEKGFYFPVDFAAVGSSHIAGNLATNAGGMRVVRYGLIRNWVLGMKIVTGNGEVLSFNGSILKNNTGYDLKQLFIGSEGTLGIITEVTLRLTQKPKDSRVLFLAVAEFNQILSIFEKTHSSGLNLMAFEFLSHTCMQKVEKHLDIHSPFSEAGGYYILIEFEFLYDDQEELLFAFLEAISEQELIVDGSIAQNSKQSQTFWKYREGISESLSILHTVHKNDISLPLYHMNAFIDELQDLLAQKYPGFEIALFGHIGDGNLHLNILKPAEISDEDFFQSCKKVDPDIFTLIAKYSGSISAEHGIGLLKKDFLSYSRSQQEIETMRQIKAIFDPKSLLNPGKIFD